MALSGASEPLRMAMEGPGETGRSSGRMISGSATTTSCRFSAKVLPVQVRTEVSTRPPSCLSTAWQPPASSNASMRTSPVGRGAERIGTVRPISRHRA